MLRVRGAKLPEQRNVSFLIETQGLRPKGQVKKRSTNIIKGALSRYSVIFCAILLWGKIMAAVRFSIVAELRTIRLCVDNRCRLFGGPMLQLLRHARWHRSGFASRCWCKGDRRKLSRARKLRDVTLDLRHRLQSRTRKRLLGTSAEQDDEKQLLLSSPLQRRSYRSPSTLTPFPASRGSRSRCSDFYEAGAAIGLTWCGLGLIGAIFLPQKNRQKSLNSVTVHL